MAESGRNEMTRGRRDEVFNTSVNYSYTALDFLSLKLYEQSRTFAIVSELYAIFPINPPWHGIPVSQSKCVSRRGEM